MAITATISHSVNGIGDAVTREYTTSGSLAYDLSESIPDATVHQLLNIAFVLDDLALFCIVSDQEVTIKTNDSGTPQEQYQLAAGEPLIYVPGAGYTAPFADDVTAIYISNASGATATVIAKVLVDASP